MSLEDRFRFATDPFWELATGRRRRHIERFDRVWQRAVCVMFGHTSDDDGYVGYPCCVWCRSALERRR